MENTNPESRTNGKMMIFEKMAKAFSKIEAVSKNRRNDQQNFNFRGIDDVYNMVHGVLSENEIFIIPDIVKEEMKERMNAKGTIGIHRTLTVQYSFYTTDGSNVNCTVMGEALDYGDKSISKAMAIAHKYALLQIFCIPTSDMVDPDSESPTAKAQVQNKPNPPVPAQASKPQPAPSQNSDKSPSGKPNGKFQMPTWVQAADSMKHKIETRIGEGWKDFLGSLGYERLEEVETINQTKVMAAISKKLNEVLAAEKQAKAAA